MFFFRSILQNGFITVLVCHLTTDRNLEETQIQNVFFQQLKVEQPVIKVIS